MTVSAADEVLVALLVPGVVVLASEADTIAGVLLTAGTVTLGRYGWLYTRGGRGGYNPGCIMGGIIGLGPRIIGRGPGGPNNPGIL